jgi:hypothetical protein
VVVATVVGGAATLRAGQTADSLLRAGSFAAAMGQVLFFGFPGMVVYLLLCHRWTGTITGGFILLGLTVSEWSQVAPDWHSTASIGPFFLGWVLLPTLFALGAAVAHVARRRLADRSATRGAAPDVGSQTGSDVAPQLSGPEPG